MPVTSRVRVAVYLQVALSLIGFGVWSVNALAQEESKTEVAERAKAAAKTAKEAETRSAAYAALGLSAPVSYAAVLKDPDNIDLNVRFAKTQVAEGNLTGASATLERVLLVNPALPPVRLLYAIVLSRLERYQDAERELNTLRQQPLPAAVRDEVDRYLSEAHLHLRRTRYSDSLTVGWGYDRNRNSASSSKERLFADARLPLTDTSRRRHDTSLIVVQTLDVAHDLPSQAGHQLTGSFTYYRGEQTRVNDLDLESFSLEGGGILNTWLGRITPTATVTNTLLSMETYERTQGGKVRLDRSLTNRLGLFLEGGWASENFSGINENAAAPEQTGDRATVTLGGSALATPTTQLGVTLAYDRKRAKADYFAYEGFTMGGTHTWILPGGQFVLNSLTYEVDSYDAPDFAISSRKRLDRQLRFRTTYGLPLALVVPERIAPKGFFKDLTATATFEQFRSLSKVVNYTYSNSKFNLMLTKRVEF